MEGYAATNSEGKIVGVTFADVCAKGSKVAILGPVAALAPGTGKKTFMAACAHAEKLGFSTLVSQDTCVRVLCLRDAPRHYCARVRLNLRWVSVGSCAFRTERQCAMGA